MFLMRFANKFDFGPLNDILSKSASIKCCINDLWLKWVQDFPWCNQWHSKPQNRTKLTDLKTLTNTLEKPLLVLCSFSINKSIMSLSVESLIYPQNYAPTSLIPSPTHPPSPLFCNQIVKVLVVPHIPAGHSDIFNSTVHGPSGFLLVHLIVSCNSVNCKGTSIEPRLFVIVGLLLHVFYIIIFKNKMYPNYLYWCVSLV